MTTLLALSALISAAHQAASPPVASEARPALDPNQMICRRYRESGSRIAVRRTCMTRREWAAHRTELKQNVDRAQTTRVIAPR